MKRLLALYLCISMAAVHAETIDEMKSAIQADQQLGELARQVVAIKKQLDDTVGQYKAFRKAFTDNQKLSADTAAAVVDADLAAGIDPTKIKEQLDAETAKKAVEAGKVYKSAAEKKRALEATVTVWKNKLDAAQRLIERGQAEMGVAPRGGGAIVSDGGRRESRDGWNSRNDPATTQTGSGSMTFNGGAEEQRAAQAKIDQGNKDAEQARNKLWQAQQELSNFMREFNAVDATKKAADAAAPAKTASKKIAAVYVMNDGTTLDALSAIEAGDEVVIKTELGMKTVKKSDIKDIRYQLDFPDPAIETKAGK